MEIKDKQDFISISKSFNIQTKYIIVKPNWINNQTGLYTDSEILGWLFEAFPKQNKIVVESYTPWRGLKFMENNNHKGEGVTLEEGKKHWNFYKEQDSFFLRFTGIDAVLKKHKAEYLNITNEVWGNRCVNAAIIKKLLNKNKSLNNEEFCSYIPQKLIDVRNDSTFISLSKIKLEETIPAVMASMSLKNLFGLLPHPSRKIFHGEQFNNVSDVINDLHLIYTTLFKKNLWITEGIYTLVKNYSSPTQQIIKGQNLLFIGESGSKVDSEACSSMGIEPQNVPYLRAQKL